MTKVAKKPPVPKKKAGPKTGKTEQVSKAQKSKEFLGQGGKNLPSKKLKKTIVYPDIKAEVFGKDQTNPPIDTDLALEWLGWEVVDTKENPGPYSFLDFNKAKVRLNNNPTNRPFRMSLAKRYMMEILRGKWALNGETITFDRCGYVQSGQHRLVGLILAEQLRRKEPSRWHRYGWRSPITMASIVVFGISDEKEVVDTIDLGQKRSLGDVIFRDAMFDANDKVKRQLSTILANATRLAWLRASGAVVTDAPHFPHSEALDFIEEHQGLITCVNNIHELEGGAGVNGGRISRYISLGYAAGLQYLMMASGTEPDDFIEQGAAAINLDMEEKAVQFWTKFASGAELKADDPIFVLRELLPRVDASSAVGRDEKVGMVIKAFNRWAEGKKAQSKDIVMKKGEDDMGRLKLTEEPRLGGLDTEKEETDRPEDELEEPSSKKTPKKGAIPKHKEKRDDREGVMAGDEWAEGDTAWVKSQDGEHWFGTVAEVFFGEDGIPNSVNIRPADDEENLWNEPTENLSVEYPSP